MKKKSVSVLLALGLLLGLVMTGCGSSKAPENNEPAKIEVKEEVKEEVSEEISEETDEEASKEQTEESAEAEEEKGESLQGETSGKPATNDFFSKCDGLLFTFASGAGAWSTEMTIKADGSFSGLYHDSDMGDMDENKYPNGTVYVSNFKGQFGPINKVNDHTYSTTIKSIELERKPGEEEYADGVRYIYSEPYGIDGAEEILFFTADTPLKDLPEDYRSWVWIEDESKGVLGFIGMYNKAQGDGFSSYYDAMNATANVKVDDSLTGIDKELATVQAKADQLANDLKTRDLSQTEMNMINSELYTLWDDELNSVWKQLKATLDEKTMADITADEKQWIKYKETQMEDEAKDWEGGSGWAMVYYGAGAKLTSERVYYLAEYLK